MTNKKYLTNKKNKYRGGKKLKKKVKTNKKTQKKEKKKDEKIKPREIGRILSNIHILLSFPSIEFLPSTNIFNKNNTGHYLNMIDYQELASIINDNSKYKKSPTIQKIFNYQSYQLEPEEKIIFNYKNIKCDNLIIKEQKNHNVRLLFLYLLECNTSDRLKQIIKMEGGDGGFDLNEMINYDVDHKRDEFEEFQKQEKIEEEKRKKEEEYEKIRELEREKERVREMEREKIEERKEKEEEERRRMMENEKEREIQKEESFKDEIQEKNEILMEDKEEVGEQEEKTIDEKIDEEEDKLEELKERHEEFQESKEVKEKEEKRLLEKDIQMKIDFEKQLHEKERKIKEEAMKERMEMEKQINIKIKGFEEFLEDKKVSNVASNSFAIYNVNWFNVCCGLEKYDESFEEEVQNQINEMGLIINEEEITESLKELFEDEEILISFKNMIKNRLLTCSEIEPPSFFEKLFTDSFGTFKNCDERSPQSILYLYDGYTEFLEKTIELSKLERILILIYCETRQHILSKYISLELIRRDETKTKKEKVISILDKIMKGDKTIIKKNDKILEEQMKLKFKGFKEKKLLEIIERERIRESQNINNITLQENNLELLSDQKEYQEKEEGPGFFDKLKNLFEKNKDENISFEIALTPNEKLAYEKAMKKMKGGGNKISYELTPKEKNDICNQMKEEKNIYKTQLNVVNDCFN